MGAKRDGQSTRRNQRPSGQELPPATGKREPVSPGEEGSPFVVLGRSDRQSAPQGLWRTAKRPELQKRRGGEKEKEASELANSPSSAKSSESCVSCALLLIFGSLRLCPAAHRSRSRPTDYPLPTGLTSAAPDTTAEVSQGQGERWAP
ncbi:uncharacterized protein WM294_016719 [Sarcoramphus papa]